MYGWWEFVHCPQVWRWRALLRTVDMLLVMKREEQWKHCWERTNVKMVRLSWEVNKIT